MHTNNRRNGILYVLFALFFLTSSLEAQVLKKVKKVYLFNGLLVLLKEDHTLPLVTLQVWIRVGSVYEKKDDSGVTHFIEHMLFKGTKKYGSGEIARIIESHGGRINAGTGKDFTVIYVNVPKEALDIAIEIVANVLQNTTFPEEEIERERLVILEEIKRHDDDPESLLWDMFNEKIYSTTPYRYRVIGTTETIAKMTRETLIHYYGTYYIPNNMTLVVVGDIKTKQLLPKIKTFFETLPRKELSPLPLLTEIPKENFVHREKRPVQQAYFLSGFLGPTVESNDQYALDVLSVILGEGRNSRLYKNLREEKELVWGIGTSFLTQKGTGLFIISAQAEKDKIDQAADETYAELTKLQKNGITDKELTRAKTLIESSWLFSNETYSGQAHTLGYAATIKDIKYAREYLRNISAVKKEDIKYVVDTYFQGKKLNLIVFYPEK